MSRHDIHPCITQLHQFDCDRQKLEQFRASPRIDPIHFQNSFRYYCLEIKTARCETRIESSRSRRFFEEEDNTIVAVQQKEEEEEEGEEREFRERRDFEDVSTWLAIGLGRRNVQKMFSRAIEENVLSIMRANPANVCDELRNFHPLVHLSGGSYGRRFEEIPNFLFVPPLASNEQIFITWPFINCAAESRSVKFFHSHHSKN